MVYIWVMRYIITLLAITIFIGCSKKQKIDTLRVRYVPTGSMSYFHMEIDEKPITVKNYGFDYTKPVLSKNLKIEFNSYSPGMYKDSIYVYYNNNLVYKDYVMDLKKDITLE